MKRNIKMWYIALIVVLITGCEATRNDNKTNNNEPTINELCVVSYNLENLFDYTDDPENNGDDEYLPTDKKEWDAEKYQTKLNNLSEVIRAIDSVDLPEIIGVCEIENRKVLEDLIATDILKNAGYGISHEESPDPRGIDVALIYKKSHFKYLKHEPIKVISKDGKTYPTRYILYTQGTINNDTFHIFVNHWSSRRGGEEDSEHKRIAAAKTLRNYIDENILNSNPDANIIIMGDMNDEPQNESLSETLNAKNNNPPEEGELYNVMYELDLVDIGSYSYKNKWIMLDNIIISPNLLNSEKGFICKDAVGTVFYDERFLYYNSKADEYIPSKTYGGDKYYGGYSDHLPVYMFLINQTAKNNHE